ncbi:hypothetical protein J3E69DRAFT_179072 [Trichoderma sp. SZMC 28015]
MPPSLAKSSCMIDRLVHAPPRPQFVRLPSPHSAAAAGRPSPLPLFFLLVPQLTAAAECYGILLLLVSTQPAVLIFILELVPLLASSVLVSNGPAPPPGPRLLPVSAPGLSRITRPPHQPRPSAWCLMLRY